LIESDSDSDHSDFEDLDEDFGSTDMDIDCAGDYEWGEDILGEDFEREAMQGSYEYCILVFHMFNILLLFSSVPRDWRRRPSCNPRI